MDTLLVTTDFSEHSRAGLRFALQLAAQGRFKLVFLHVTELLKPIKWTESFYKSFEQNELSKLEQELKTLVMGVSAEMGSTIIDPQYVVRNSSSVPANMVHYAEQHQIPYICISRKGGGNSLRLFGSVVSTLMEKSTIPIIAVPEDYQPVALDKVCYAADLSNLQHELSKVLEFADKLNAGVQLLHFKDPAAGADVEERIAVANAALGDKQLEVHVKPSDIQTALSDRLAQAVDELHPAMLIMFTRQERSFFERIFLSSISAEFAEASAVPLLVYRKD